MQVRYLEIKRAASYEPNPGQFVGKITFVDSEAEVSIMLDSSACLQILKVCASSIVKTSQRVADTIIEDITNSGTLLIPPSL